MIKLKRGIMFYITCYFASLLIMISGSSAKAAELIPTASDNLRVGLKSSSELVATDDGYMRVFCDGEKIGIEYYNDSFQIQSKQSLPMELDIWGGFYAGSDAYYLVEGQNNTEESDTAEIIRVIQYDTQWNKKGIAKITGNPDLFGGEVRYPFNYGCVEMEECNGMLYIVTGHEGYVDPNYNQGHQGFLMIAVDETSMTGSIVDCDLWHSFAQYIEGKDSDLYVLEQSEGSRYTKLSKYNMDSLKSTSIPVLKYGGKATSAWAIACYASVDGMAVSSDYVLGLGTSIDQSKYDEVSKDTAHNIYLTVTPLSDFSESATTVKWLTDYTGDGKSFLGTKITKVNENRFMISWEESDTSQDAALDDGLSTSVLHYLFVDGAGNVIGREFTEAAPISDCQPILKGDKIVYYASNANMVNFYSIDSQTGEFTKKVYRVAGENATWNIEDRVLTISGTGPMRIDTEAYYRYPISSVAGSVSYYSSDNVWKALRKSVTKIVIEGGITEIPANAFEYFNSLTEVELKPGVSSIGEKAFYSCEALEKITIPSSVTSIGEDFLWTGSYWVFDESHVVKAAIYAPKDSYAAAYANENGISYQISSEQDDNTNNDNGNGTDDGNGTVTGGTGTGNSIGMDADVTTSITGAAISGIKTEYAYTGKRQMPKVTVMLGGKKLAEGVDYTVTYLDNSKTGKATIIIKGINGYRSTIQRSFYIVPKKAAAPKLKSTKLGILKIKWKKDSQATGYQIQYAGNAKFTKNKKNVVISKKTVVSKKISKLVKGKKYFVRVRAYKKIGGKKRYGAWSKTVKIRIR